tara:strand:- start:846 stop:980 length:135 start_codon:yes stop_codon:yes gene_type:complete
MSKYVDQNEELIDYLYDDMWKMQEENDELEYQLQLTLFVLDNTQ